MEERAENRAEISVEIRVRGTVQGVGFRPMVWRLAHEHGLRGDVCNDADGVLIRATGSPTALETFQRGLRSNAPPLARIDRIDCFDGSQDATGGTGQGFHILASSGGRVRTQIAPDAATCNACRDEILDPAQRRYGYAFTNCTHCGPRFSIVRTVPYDRASTTMAAFAMCPTCRREYENPADRRFHAQPIACPECGPRLWLERFSAPDEPDDLADPIAQAVRLLKDGAILAIRGLGGFHLACDATDADAVTRLRARKRRYGKPFALMARDCGVVRQYCRLGEAEQQVLQTAAAPIVILDAKPGGGLPAAIAPGLDTLGFMLPYTPLHHLLMRGFDGPLVMTSGNLSDEPQVTGNAEAREKLAHIAEYALMHDREIANRIDDSLVRLVGGAPCVLRRARGFAPGAILLPKGFEAAPEVLAYGGELKSTFCLLKDGAAIVSQHQGDLESVPTLDDFEKNLTLYTAMFDHEPDLLAADMHPEYLSTKLAKETAQSTGRELHLVQHHHAHVAACMAENGVGLTDGPVLGVVLDGLGLGDDGRLWGGEFLVADYVGFTRLASFLPVSMPGGAMAAREPWRNTHAHLVSALGWERFASENKALDISSYLASKPLDMLEKMQAHAINSPPASSCGRLFDAVAAAVGLCRDRAQYEGQAAIELEAAARRAPPADSPYRFDLTTGDAAAPAVLRPDPMWSALLADLRRSLPVPVIARRFHDGLARAVADTAAQLIADRARAGKRLTTVALSGGCFQNQLLLQGVLRRLSGRGLCVITHSEVPANDGGLSLGQAAIAAARHLHDTDPQGRN